MLSRVNKNKKGISAVIGYILIMTVSIVMSIIVYQWIKTYVPKEALECPEEVSIFVSEINCEDSENSKNITLNFTNNGKFSVDGYSIRASNNPNTDSIAVIDLSERFYGSEVQINENIVKFGNELNMEDNSFTPGELEKHKFNITLLEPITKIEIIPSRIEIQDNFKRIAICTSSKIEIINPCS